MSDSDQTFNDIVQATEQTAESSSLDDELLKIAQTLELMQERLIDSFMEIFEAFGCISIDEGDDGLVDEELDLSDVPEAER